MLHSRALRALLEDLDRRIRLLEELVELFEGQTQAKLRQPGNPALEEGSRLIWSHADPEGVGVEIDVNVHGTASDRLDSQ